MSSKMPYAFLNPYLNAPLMGRNFVEGIDPLPPFGDERITEDGVIRVTEDNQIRITE